MFDIRARSDGITTKEIAKYFLLPGILPRLKNLGFSLNRVVFMLAQMMGASGLIDRQHPCLIPSNVGVYSFSQIMLIAWQNVRFDRQHILQTMMFFSVVLSVVLMAGIVFILGTYTFINFAGPAQAQYFGFPDGSAGIAYTPKDDWAFNFLERIFGGKQNTGIDFWITGDNVTGANPWYTALMIGMLKVYSQALLFIATFMILYILLMALADAARSGKPFGEKFDPIWAPIRFAIAIGLLLPVSGSGYNGAQMLVFQSAEWGSNLATNLWHRGISTKDPEKNRFITASVTDPGYRFLRDVFLINLCWTSYNSLVKAGKYEGYDKYLKAEPNVSVNSNSVSYRWGIDQSSDFCGEIVLPNPQKYSDIPDDYLETVKSSDGYLPKKLADTYSNALMVFMPGTTNNIMNPAVQEMSKLFFCDLDKKLTELECGGENCTALVDDWVYTYWKSVLGRDVNNPKMDYFLAEFQTEIDNYNKWLYLSLQKDAKYGWASAGAFYLRMSYALSILDDIVASQPYVSKLPTNFYEIYATPDNRISNRAAELECKTTPGEKCKAYAGSYLLSTILHKGADWFLNSAKMSGNTEFHDKVNAQLWESNLRMADKEETTSNNAAQIFTPIKLHLYDLVKLDNSTLNPLGQVITWGNRLIYVAESAFVLAAVVTIWGFGKADAIASMLVTLGQILIVPGFLLMFVIPLMPFLYFAFAVIEWIVSIVEAVIGLPLWALTFITAEGNLMGQAIGGAKMLFEIILRPTIIIMSLLSAIIIFTAAVSFFNNAFTMFMEQPQEASSAITDGIKAAGNASPIPFHGVMYDAVASATQTVTVGFVGAFGMMLFYMIAIYTLAMGSFKLIDAIPNGFGRWLGLEGGFGSIIHMGSTGGEVALASAYVAKEGVGYGIRIARAFNPNKPEKDDEDDGTPPPPPPPSPGHPNASFALGAAAAMGAGATGTGNNNNNTNNTNTGNQGNPGNTSNTGNQSTNSNNSHNTGDTYNDNGRDNSNNSRFNGQQDTDNNASSATAKVKEALKKFGLGSNDLADLKKLKKHCKLMRAKLKPQVDAGDLAAEAKLKELNEAYEFLEKALGLQPL